MISKFSKNTKKNQSKKKKVHRNFLRSLNKLEKKKPIRNNKYLNDKILKRLKKKRSM